MLPETFNPGSILSQFRLQIAGIISITLVKINHQLQEELRINFSGSTISAQHKIPTYPHSFSNSKAQQTKKSLTVLPCLLILIEVSLWL